MAQALVAVGRGRQELGLYDGQGVLRFAGRDQADCLAYADLFGLEAGEFCLQPLTPAA